MKEKRFLIETAPKSGEYVDGKEDGKFEFTFNRRAAWRMKEEYALRQLEHLKETKPEAHLIPV